MSNTTNDTTVKIPFVVRNILGQINSPNTDKVESVIYSNEGYKIGLEMYEHPYRKSVLWDFGDGESLYGAQVEHHYKKPGKYTISCTLFDADRIGIKNEYTVDVVVKELIPTQLRFFDTKNVKKEIACSKIEKIATIECLISDVTDAPLNVVVKRIYDKKSQNEVSKGKSYFDLNSQFNFHIQKYWTTLRNKRSVYNNLSDVYVSDLTPSEIFSPSYSALYYRLVKTTNNEIGLKFYQVLPYKTIDDRYTKIKVVSPKSTIYNEILSTYAVENVYDINNLPQDAIYCGLRGFTDIYYRNDFVEDVTTLSVFYDVEVGDITRELSASGNYINVAPLGFNVKTTGNNISLDTLRIGVSGNFFLNDTIGNIKIFDTFSKVFIDPYFEGSLYNGLDINCYIFPVFHYTENDDIKPSDNSYYIPKDTVIEIGDWKYNISGNEDYGEPSIMSLGDSVGQDIVWVKKIPIQLNNYIDITLDTNVIGRTIQDEQPTVSFRNEKIRICQKPLRSLIELKIPKENVSEVDVDNLLDAYMRHPMFLDTPNTRELLRIFITSFVENVQTEGNNFVDNVANSKTCYLSHLISQLKMMGEEVVEYENSRLEGINDLKTFSRLLSMNHSELIGHQALEDWDISIINDNRGKNVGDRVKMDDVLRVSSIQNSEVDYNNYVTFGKITHFNGEKLDGIGTDLILYDKFSGKSKIVHLRDCLNDYIDTVGGMPIYINVKISDYNNSWGWNLLLPENFNTIGELIEKYKGELSDLENKLQFADTSHEKDQLNSEIAFYKTEIESLKMKRGSIITGYYEFFLLNNERNVIRQGNFIPDENITEEIASLKEWDKLWGISHDILMKILMTNGNLINRDKIYADRINKFDAFWESTTIALQKTFNKMPQSFGDDNVETDSVDIIVNDVTDTQYKFTGSFSLRGKVFSEGENSLEMKLHECYIDDIVQIDFLYDSDRIINFVANGRDVCDLNGEEFVYREIRLYDKYGKIDTEKSKIAIFLRGTVDNPELNVIVKIYYSPSVIKRQLKETFLIDAFQESENSSTEEESENSSTEEDYTITIDVDSRIYTSSGELDDNFETNALPFRLPISVLTSIEGSGKKRSEVKLGRIDFKYGNENDYVISFSKIDKLFLDFFVDENGTIYGADYDPSVSENLPSSAESPINSGVVYLKGSYNNVYGISDGNSLNKFYKGTYKLDDYTWIKISLWGNISNPEWKIECGTGEDGTGYGLIKFYYDYKAFSTRYEYKQPSVVDNDLLVKLYTNDKIDENYEYSVKNYTTDQNITYTFYEIPSEVKIDSCDLIQLSNGIYKMIVNGSYTTNEAKFADSDVIWKVSKPINQSVEISVDNFGNIYSYSGDDKKEYEYSFNAWNKNDSVELINEDDFNIILTVSGNVLLDKNIQIKAENNSIQPSGVLVRTFGNITIKDSSLISSITVNENGSSVSGRVTELKCKFVAGANSDFAQIVTSKGSVKMGENDSFNIHLDFTVKAGSHTDAPTDKLNYVTDNIGNYYIYVTEFGETKLRTLTPKRRSSSNDNYLKYYFSKKNFDNGDIEGKNKYYSLDDEVTRDYWFTINENCELSEIDLQLLEKIICKYDIVGGSKTLKSKEQILDNNRYRAECDVKVNGIGFVPDDNGEIVELIYTISPKVRYSTKLGGVSNEYMISLTEHDVVLPVKYKMTKNGNIYIAELDQDENFDGFFTYKYQDVKNISEESDIDGDVNYEVSFKLPQPKLSLREQSSKGFEINVDFDTIDVNLIVIERAFKKTISNIVWDENDSHISGHFALDFNGNLTNDENSTSVKVNLSDFELSVYSIQIPQNEIHLYVKGNHSGKNEIILDENVSGEETIVLYCSYHKNGQIIEFEKEVDVLFTAVATDDKEKIICTPKTPKVTFIDNRYDVRKNISNFLSNGKIVNDVLVGKSGGVSISGEKKSANLTSHGIKDEEFHGLLKVINPRLHGVTLNVDKIAINGVLTNEFGENAMKLDTTTSPSGVPLKTTSVKMTIDDVDEFGRQHEIAKPVDVKIKMSKNDFYRTESFKFYRDENEDDGNPMKKDIFEVKIIPNDDDKGNENEKPFVPIINDVYGEFSFNANDETKIQITDRTNYSEYAGLEKGTNDVTSGNYYKLSTDFGIKDLYESSKISIYGGYLSLSAQLSNESQVEHHDKLSINGVYFNKIKNGDKLSDYDLTKIVSLYNDYDDSGKLDSTTSFDFRSHEDSPYYALSCDVHVGGDVTKLDDNYICEEITSEIKQNTVNLTVVPKKIEKNLIITSLSNSENNEYVSSGASTTFAFGVNFWAAPAKISTANVNYSSQGDYTINGLIVNTSDISQTTEVTVDVDRTFQSDAFTSTMSDEFGLVGIAVNGQIIGDTSGENGNINSNIFTVSISAKDLITDNTDFNNTTSYAIQGGAKVSSSKIEGASYPNNGKVGIAPRILMSGNDISFGDNTSKITLTCKSEDLVGCATFNTKDKTIKIQKITTSENGESYSDYTPTQFLYHSDEMTTDNKGEEVHALVVTSIFDVNGEYDSVKKEITIFGHNQIDENSIKFTPIKLSDIVIDCKSVGNNTNLTLSNVWVYLGKEVTFVPNGSAQLNGINLGLVLDGSVTMNGYSINDEKVVYEKTINGTTIAKLTYNLNLSDYTQGGNLSGELTNTGTQTVYLKPIPVGVYTFTEQNIVGSITISTDEVLRLTEDKGIKMYIYTSELYYNSTEIYGLDGESFEIYIDYENGSVTEFTKDFELKSENSSIIVTGTLTFGGNISNDNFNVSVSNIKVTDNAKNYIRYSDNGEVLTARLWKVKNANQMFRNQNVTKIGCTMPIMESAKSMFAGCNNLTTFSSNMDSLRDGSHMFKGCKKLSNFSARMTSIEQVNGMFNDCILDDSSVRNIVIQLKNNKVESTESKSITLGVDKSLQNDDDFMSFISANKSIVSKGGITWAIKLNWN